MTVTRTLRRLGLASLAIGVALTAFAPSYAAGPGATESPTDHRQPTAAPDPADGDITFTSGSDGSAALDDKLGTRDLTQLRKAEVTDGPVTVLVATDPGATDAVSGAVDAAGGTVGRSEDDLGYVRATIPPDVVAGLADRDDVLAIDLDRTFKVPDTQVGGHHPGHGRHRPDAPDSSTRADNPYLPVGEIGAVRFTDGHRSWDGRGVTVGILDTGVDLAHPALQRTTTGQPKVADWFTATDPVLDNDPSWAQIRTYVDGPTARVSGATWTLPAGHYGLAIYNEATFRGELGGDLNRDGDTSDRIGMLYDPATDDIRVDTDLDLDFTDETVMRPYGEDHQVGRFGTDDPSTDVVEQLPFTVDYQVGTGDSVFVNLGVVSGAHGTHVAGIVAGNGILGGRMRGAAPGAQVVSARACVFSGGCSSVALTEGMIDLVTEHHVDVVNLSIGGLTALNDDSDAIAQLYDRLIDEYGVQIVMSAGNDGAGVNTVSPPSTAEAGISVAASVSKQTWWADYGAEVRAGQGVFAFSARGPGEDGSAKPTLAAPGAAISSVPTWMPGSAVPETGYELPAGYELMNGTSMAAPEATGSAALLLSAAKATDTPVTASGLKTALTDGARLIDDVPTAAQGSGLIDVPAAWRVLARGVESNGYDVAAPVCSSLSSLLTTPDTGRGVYNRCLPGEGGQRVGRSKTYDVEVTRTGGRGRGRHQVSWIGNDGTFSAPRSIDLDAGESAEIPVTARTSTPGLHSAILKVDDPATTGTDLLVPVTVVVPRSPSTHDRAVVDAGSVRRSTTHSFFVAVPKDVANLQLKLSGFGDEDVRVVAFDPSGMPQDGSSASRCFTGSDPGDCDPTDRSYLDPAPGIWEFQVEARRTSRSDDNRYRATVSLQGVSLDPATSTLDEMAVQRPQTLEFTGTNEWGTTRVHAKAGQVGRVREQVGEVADGATDEAGVYIPRDVTEFDMSFVPAEDDADVDVYVFLGTTLVHTALTPGPGGEEIRLVDPQPGTYHLIVAGTHVPSGSTAFDYHEQVYSSGIGTVTPTDDRAHELRPGGRLPVRAAITATAEPLNDEGLVASVPVANEQGTTIGHAEVRIASVTTPEATVLGAFHAMVASDMTDAGMVVGDRQVKGFPTPTRWTAEGGFVDYDLGENGRFGSVYDVNGDGLGTGEISRSSDGSVVGLWQVDGTRVEVGRPTWRAYNQARGFGVNDSGVVVGDARGRVTGDDGVTTAYDEGWRWTQAGGFTRLPDLGEDPTGTTPFAINNDGYVTGVSRKDGYQHAALWRPDGTVADLGVLPGQLYSMAEGINDNKTVVGESGDDAFVWTRSGGMRRLPDLGFNATATKVTGDGWILGSAEVSPDESVPVVWDPQGRIYDINKMMDTSVFYASEAMAINSRHQVVVYGFDDSDSGSGMRVIQLPDLP